MAWDTSLLVIPLRRASCARWYDEVMRSAFQGTASALILQNSDDMMFFRESKIVDERSMRLIRGAGVDFNRFVPRPEPIRDRVQPLRVLLAARLIWEGIGEYVEAARILKDENRSIRFLLAGSPDKGNPAAVETRLVRGWSEEGLLEWLGHVDDMRSLLSNVDVVVLPSYYREGLPTTLVEGAACALPLITTDGPGCREVVSCNGTDGLIVPPRDARALADGSTTRPGPRTLPQARSCSARKRIERI